MTTLPFPLPASYATPAASQDGGFGDRQPAGYWFHSDIALAVNLALVTGRPLLVRGPAGCGKSSMARAMAAHYGRSYYEAVITARTEARDLMWSFDSVGRLGAANRTGTRVPASDPAVQARQFVVPGVLWWAFDPLSAAAYGRSQASPRPVPDGAERRNDGLGAIVLLDEIDKADPDLPNNLLAPLSLYEFTVSETGRRVSLPIPPSAETRWQDEAKRLPLIVITTNSERELPEAFLRRCIDLKLAQPTTREELSFIAAAHFARLEDQTTVADVIDRALEAILAKKADKGRIPSTAEILDTIRICLRLKQEGTDYSEVWDKVRDMALLKTGARRS